MLRALARQNSPIILSQSGVPVGIPSSGSIGNNGALTGLTTFGFAFSGFLYFPANAIFAGSAAGFYWVVLSSGTAGTIYNNTYTSGDAVAPATATPFVTTGPGAYTQSTGEITLRPCALPGGMVGSNGRARFREKLLFNNSANNKTVKSYLGVSSNILSEVRTTSANDVWDYSFENMGGLSSQVMAAWPVPLRAGGGGFATVSVNTGVDQSLALTGQLANATDFILSINRLVEVLPS